MKWQLMKGEYMRKILITSAWVVLLAAGIAQAQGTTVESPPPSVVKTVPQAGDQAVDAAATKQIAVTFSKEMKDGSWSWALASEETFPEIVGKPRYLGDRKTCVVNVKLEPHKKYIVWINSKKFTGFKDVEGNSAVPYLLEFQTR